MNEGQEKRSYYRIKDVVGLTYHVIDENEDEAAQEQAADLSVTSLLAEIDRDFNRVSNILWHEHPTFARAVGLLNRKLSIIAAHAVREEDEESGSHEELVVSISGSGLAFGCQEALPAATRLQLALVLKPSNITLHLTATVIACDMRESSHWIRLAFDEGNDAAQEQLIQHVVQRQCAQISESGVAVD